MKKADNLLRDYVARLSPESLKYLMIRFADRVGPDLSEAINVLSKNYEIDKWLLTAIDGNEFFDMVDMIANQVEKEYNRRGPDVMENVY